MQVGWSISSRKAQFCRSAMPLWLIFPTLTGERCVIKRNGCVQNLQKKKKNQLVDYLYPLILEGCHLRQKNSHLF